MKQQVYLIGAGMGGRDTMTVQAMEAAERCPLLLGASRLLDPWREGHTCVAAVTAAELAEQIHEAEEGPVGVLFSGDTGFYSGTKTLLPLLKDCQVQVLPGISSLSCFCARLGVTWQDVHLVSAHGRAHNALGEVQSHEKTFFLTGGACRVEHLCADLVRGGLGDLNVAAGERLGDPSERICTGTAAQLAGQQFDSLAVMLVWNPAPVQWACTAPGLPDDAFLRGKVPMTKSEVRAVVLSKLRPRRDHVLWDVGAGTGSVSVECALACPQGRVYAVERKEEAVELLGQNKARFGVSNLELVPGEAPAALQDLPAPDRVFLGGTGGALDEILNVIFEKNPTARIVISAVTLETLDEAVRCCEARELADLDVVQVAVTRTRRVGNYHMMDAQNPVWIVSGEGRA